jgi:hypothetical protein
MQALAMTLANPERYRQVEQRRVQLMDAVRLLLGRHHARDHLGEPRAIDRNGSRARRAHLHLQMQDNAAGIIRAHDPAEAAQRHWWRLAARVLLALERKQHLAKQLPKVGIGPAARIERHRFEARGSRGLRASDPDIDFDRSMVHGLSVYGLQSTVYGLESTVYGLQPTDTTHRHLP